MACSDNYMLPFDSGHHLSVVKTQRPWLYDTLALQIFFSEQFANADTVGIKDNCKNKHSNSSVCQNKGEMIILFLELVLLSHASLPNWVDILCLTYAS